MILTGNRFPRQVVNSDVFKNSYLTEKHPNCETTSKTKLLNGLLGSLNAEDQAKSLQMPLLALKLIELEFVEILNYYWFCLHLETAANLSWKLRKNWKESISLEKILTSSVLSNCIYKKQSLLLLDPPLRSLRKLRSAIVKVTEGPLNHIAEKPRIQRR